MPRLLPTSCLGDLKHHDIDNIFSTILPQRFTYELTRCSYQTLFTIVVYETHC
jgi:hypothetical protein